MAEKQLSEDLDNILNLLGLKQFYPEHLSRDDLYQITSDNILPSDGNTFNQTSRQFINKITRYNYRARNIQSESSDDMQPDVTKLGYRERARRKRDKETSAIHPLEVILAVFLCCDSTARQDLAMHLWGCKLAIPLLAHISKDMKPDVFIWPLRSLIGQFQTDNGLTEMQLLNRSMKSIAIMRVGPNEHISKSYLLNCLIGGPEKAHPVFFHRNSEGSKRDKTTITDGMIEVGWFLSSESSLDKFVGPRLFLNVRGNSEHLDIQRKFIGQLATVTVVLTTVCQLEDSVTSVEDLLKYGSHVILLLSDPSPDTNAIDAFLEKHFSSVPESKFDIVTIEGSMLSELLKGMTHNIKKLESKNHREICLGDFLKNLPSMEYNVDETQKHYARAFEVTNDIVSSIRSIDYLDKKMQLLPLQEKYWKQWSQIDRDIWRFDQLDSSEQKRYVSKSNLEAKLKGVRKSQFKHLMKQGMSKAMRLFIVTLFRSEDYEKKIFLRMLKLELDSLSRKQLRPLDIAYQDLVNKTIDASEEDRTMINQELSDIDETKVKVSFGLEHMVREMGQIFEACESQPETMICIIKEATMKIMYSELPKLACFLLLEGYPVEILDGEACSVPLLWVKNVLNCLPTELNVNESNPKVHVISVLGIQSSGKSTFLNTIFGLQFAVSAGRCTRGAFMQGVKVHPSVKESFGADYVLAIDTEGLKAAELISTNSIKHDNELSTFVIGLADTTIINLMGENATYLQENLPIAVHAFLRMNLAGLHPRCTIVHHNVDKRNKDKLLVQGRILESVLNKLTRKACELEKIPHRLFQDIIEFSISRHTDYIPALFEGEQPMAPISVGYSKEAENVRKKVIGFVNKDFESSSLSQFARHIETLWNAIKKDRFVYEFRNTLEAEARLELDQKYSSILIQYLEELDKIVDMLMPKLMSEKYTCRQVEETCKKSIASVEKKCREEMENFLLKPKRFAATCYEEWKDKYLSNLKDEITHLRNSALQQFRDHKSELSFSISMHTIESFFALIKQMSVLSRKSEKDCFDSAWTEWIKSNNLINKDVSVAKDTTKALQDVCRYHTYLLTESVTENKSLAEFKPSTERHLNHSFHVFSENTIINLHARMMSIKNSVALDYEIEVNNIKQKGMPYTNRHPKQILLRVEKHLTHQLSYADKSNEISNQFKIDLLVHTAGSVVEDFEKIVQSSAMLLPIKESMKELLLIKVKKSKSTAERLIHLIFSIIKQKIKCEFPSLALRCVLQAFNQSVFKWIIASKRLLLGQCLHFAIDNGVDTLLHDYISSPRKACFNFLKMLLRHILRKNSFVKPLRKFVEDIAIEVKSVLGQEKATDLNFEDVLENVLMCTELSGNYEMIERFRSRRFQRERVTLMVVKDLFDEKIKSFIAELTETFKENILIEQESIISSCADKLCNNLIGCEEVCPLCNEICKYSNRHSCFSKHECFVHRPVGCQGYYRSESQELSFETCAEHYELNSIFEHSGENITFKQFQTVYPDWCLEAFDQKQPSLIWKWIFLNKSKNFESLNLKLPSNLPESWSSISKKEVLVAIKDQFHLI